MNIRETKDWYYVQAFSDGGFKSRYTIVFAKTKSQAVKKVAPWLAQNGLSINKLHLYRNNYKREAAAMVAQGNYIA